MCESRCEAKSKWEGLTGAGEPACGRTRGQDRCEQDGAEFHSCWYCIRPMVIVNVTGVGRR